MCAWRYWAHQDQRRVPSGSRRAERGIETIVLKLWYGGICGLLWFTTEKYCK